MTKAPGKRELQREERRQQILDAALTVFSCKGFHAANVSDVAAQAGVSQGLVGYRDGQLGAPGHTADLFPSDVLGGVKSFQFARDLGRER